MKRLKFAVVPMVVVGLCLVGCGKKQEPEPAQAQKAAEETKPAVVNPAPTPAPAAPAAPAEAPKAAQAVQDQSDKTMKAFDSADPDTKSAVAKAIDAAKAGQYADALKQLQAVAGQAKLTPDQQQALKDLIAQIQKQMMASATNSALSNPQGAAQDLKKSLPFGK